MGNSMQKGVFVVVLLIVLVLSINNYFQIRTIQKASVEAALESHDNSEKDSPEDIELGDVMTKLQRHSNKLWFAGQANNWPLAAFYVHELEETFEELTAHEIIDEGVNISILTTQMGLVPLKVVDDAVNQKDSSTFLSSYNNLISHCNACHQTSNHPFVVIKTPNNPALDNQEYEIN